MIKILNVNRDPHTPYFIMEFFPSGSLRTKMQLKQFDLLYQNIDKIFKQAATGLAYMNASGWIHRDVKPANILVNGLGDVRIIDFAIAYKPPTGMARLFSRRQRGPGDAELYVAGTDPRSAFSMVARIFTALGPRALRYSRGGRLFVAAIPRPPDEAYHRETGESANDQRRHHRRLCSIGASNASEEAQRPAARLSRSAHATPHRSRAENRSRQAG